jgi:class 3 adenylate cyclase/tetratricopeptide (TPR) repeat protein
MTSTNGTPSGRGAAEDRRHATVLFADLSGFTAVSSRLDPEDLKDAINECFKAMELVIVNHGGTVDKYIGDCVMALFGAPTALENAAQHAINAAIAIRASVDGLHSDRFSHVPLRVHIGINTGLVAAGNVGGVKRQDYTVMGETVNLASRLQAAARDGQILVGDSTYRAASREFAFRPLRLDVKGYVRPVTAFEVLATEEHRYRMRPDERGPGGALSPMVGRAAELNQIAGILESLREGRGGVIAVVGENGIGKSRLLAETFALPVLNDLAVVEARCLAVGTNLAFHPFVDFLRNWSGVPEGENSRRVYEAFANRTAALGLHDSSEILGVAARILGIDGDAASDVGFSGVEGEALERIIHSAFSDLLAFLSRERPLLLVFEDLHWADKSSLRLLEALLPLAANHALVFALVCRPYYADTSERILAFLAAQIPEDHVKIRLQPLTTASTAELVTHLAGATSVLPGVQARIAERTEGNPFYVEEVVHAMLDEAVRNGTSRFDFELPATIEGVILARVDRLEPDAKRFLQVASVVGRRFDRNIVSELVGSDIDVGAALATLVKKGLLKALGARWTAGQRVVRMVPRTEYAFKHALTQEAVYGSLLRKSRRDLHAACARAIERRFSDHMHDAYGMLAYHYLRSDSPEKAEEYTLKAGELAARAAASHEALRYFREAYRIYQLVRGNEGDDAKRVVLERHIAQALFNTGGLSESIEHFDAALALYGQWLPKSRAALWLKLGIDMAFVLLRLHMGKHRAGKRDGPDDQTVVSMLYNRARAENVADQQRYVFDTMGAPRYLQRLDPYKCEGACEITATTGAFFAFSGLSNSTARKFLTEASHLVREKGSADDFSYRAMGTLVEFHAGDWSDRYDIDDRLMAAGLRAGRLWTADIYLNFLAERYTRQGRFDEAEQQLVRLRTLQSEYGYEFAEATETAHRAFCRLEQGRLDEAAVLMRSYYDIRREAGLHVLALSGMGKIAALAQRLDEADDHLAHAAAIIADIRRLPPYYLGAYRTSRLLVDVLRVGDGSDAGLAKKVRKSSKLAIATAKRIARERPEALRLSGRAMALKKKRGAALEYYGHAVDEAQKLGATPELSRACAEIAAVLGDDGIYRGLTAAQWGAKAAQGFSSIGLIHDAETRDGTGTSESPASIAEPPRFRSASGNGK